MIVVFRPMWPRPIGIISRSWRLRNEVQGLRAAHPGRPNRGAARGPHVLEGVRGPESPREQRGPLGPLSGTSAGASRGLPFGCRVAPATDGRGVAARAPQNCEKDFMKQNM